MTSQANDPLVLKREPEPYDCSTCLAPVGTPGLQTHCWGCHGETLEVWQDRYICRDCDFWMDMTWSELIDCAVARSGEALQRMEASTDA